MPDDQERLSEILAEAVARTSPEARERYLGEVCGEDKELRDQINSLLKAHREAGNFLRQTIMIPGGNGATTAEGPGTVIGRYKLLQEIGEGGFGRVFMAEQREPVRRMVALKIVKAGMDTKEVIARFEAERQALALMDHPNIARVLDGGTTASGRPYFVMDLVKGIPITEFCDQKQLSMEARLRLFMQVCAGVQHAHQKGIIHRDLKPSNVLVTLEQGQPVPKVIDFGIAKAMGEKLTERTLFTRFEQLIGTPAYMSPEQAEWGGVDIDTRSDIYSLGALLYELLTGTTPFEKETLAHAALDEVRRMIRETDPPRPSTRLQGLGLRLNEIAQRRHAEPSLLARLVRGDLDWIAMKALDKDRTRRYETANALATDLQRHLDNEPVIACPPNRLYEFQKSVRRHKLGFTAAGAVMVVLTAGVLVSSWEAIRARRAGQRADQAARVADNQRKRAETGEQKARESEIAAREAAEAARRNLYAADMNLAYEAWQENCLGRALELLNRHRPEPPEPDLRGWEWRHLWGLCHSEALYTLGRHSNVGVGVFGVAISPDDKLLATVGGDGEAKIWDIEGRRLIETPAANDAGYSVAFSPDGKTLAFATTRHGVKLWDVQTHREITSLPVMTLDAFCGPAVAFCPSGRQLAIGSADGRVVLWDLGTQKPGLTLPGHSRHVRALAFSPDSQTLVSAGGDFAIRVWSLPTGRAVATLTNDMSRFTALALSPDGKTAAAASWDKTIRIWDLIQQRQVAVLTNHTRWVSALAFSPDGTTLASASADYSIKLWETRAWQEVSTLKGSQDEVYGVVFSRDGKTLFSGTKDGKILAWDGRPHPPKAQVLKQPNGAQDFWLDNTTGIACCLRSNSRFNLWDPQTLGRLPEHSFPEQRSLPKHSTEHSIRDFGDTNKDFWVALSPGGQRLAIGKHSGLLYLWDVEREQQIGLLPDGWQSDAQLGSFSPDGKLLAVVAAGKGLKVWNLEKLEVVATLPKSAATPTCNPCFSTLDGAVAVGNADGTVEVWNLARKQRVADWKAHQYHISGISFVPDGNRLVTVGEDNKARLWDLESQREVLSFGRTLGSYQSVAVSPDGQRIAAGTGEGTIKIWNAATGQELVTLKGVNDWLNPNFRDPAFGNIVYGLAFLPPDGSTLVSGTMYEVRLWHAPSWAEIEAAEQRTEGKTH